MKNIVPISIVGLDCYVNSLLTVLNWKQGEFHLAFWDAWCFKYSPEHLLGESIEYPMSYVINNLQKHYNYMFKNLDSDDKGKSVRDMIKILEENMPIVLCMDMYYCNWTESYGKDHAGHIVVVNGYKNGKFLILDTMPVRVGIEIDVSEVLTGIIWAKQVDFYKNESEEITVESFLKYTLARIEKNKEFEQFERFIREISTEKISKDLKCKGYVWSVPLLNNLRRLYGNRKQFLLALDGVSSGEDKLIVEESRRRFEEIVKQWGVIVNLIYKFRIKGRIKQDNDIKERFERLLTLEKSVYKEIQDLLSKKNTKGLEKMQTELFELKFQNNYKSHFSGNEDFERISELPKELLVASTSIEFNFNEKQDNCISCCGQQKILDVDQVVKLHFVGYSTWGNQIGNLILTFEEYEENIELRLSDWCLGENFCEKIIWTGKFVTNDENKEQYNAYIYDAEISCFSDKRIVSLTLPQNEKMLLFGVYCEKLRPSDEKET